MKVGKKQKGATLLELIVALVVIGIAVAGFATVMSINLNLFAEYSHDREEHLHKYRCCAETILSETGASGVKLSKEDGNWKIVKDCNGNTIDCTECGSISPEIDKMNGYCEITISDDVGDLPRDQLVLRLSCSDCDEK